MPLCRDLMHCLVVQGEAGAALIGDSPLCLSVSPEEFPERQRDSGWAAAGVSWQALPPAAPLLCQQPTPCPGTGQP